MKNKNKPPRANYEDEINGIKFNMIFVEGGAVSIKDQKITVPDFHIAETPCTQELWRAIMDKDPKDLAFKGDKRPVERVSWLDIVKGTAETNHKAFLKELNKKSQYGSYKLPSEAMWQFAAQGGKVPERYTYAGSDNLKEVAWYNKNSHSETKPVKLKLPNKLGLYDMSGNVDEWCADVWNEKVKTIPINGLPNDDGDKILRVLRGGSWNNFASFCRVADRDWDDSDDRDDSIGFRFARY